MRELYRLCNATGILHNAKPGFTTLTLSPPGRPGPIYAVIGTCTPILQNQASEPCQLDLLQNLMGQ